MDDRWVFIAIPLGVGAIFVIGLLLTVGRALIQEVIHGPPPPPTATPRIQLDDPPEPIVPKNQYHALNLPLAEMPDRPRIESSDRPDSGDRGPDPESDETDGKT